ncbi:MAG: tryptophan 7-halogenase [Nannocystaceae bacterium]
MSPRLDESVGEGEAAACWDLLGPVYRPFFHEKSHLSLACGELASLVRLAPVGRDLDALRPLDPRSANATAVAARLVHLDRARLDPMLYDEVRERPACSFVEAKVRQIVFDHDRDRVVAVVLDDGRRLEPSVVFDATGYRALLATAARLSHRPLGRLRRMVWMHRYDPGPSKARPQPWWAHGTNLVRLERQDDGVDGLGWTVPLGDEVSLGLEVDAEADGADAVGDAMLVDALERALERRGMSVGRSYPRAGAVRHVTHRHFVRERAYGANWLLAGTAFGRVWSPASASLSGAVSAAYLAPRFVDDPQAVGSRYEASVRDRLGTERRFMAVLRQQMPREEHELYRLWAWWRAEVRRGLPDALSVAAGELPAPASPGRTRGGRVPLLRLAMAGFATVEVRRQPQPESWLDPFAGYPHHRRSAVVAHSAGLARCLRSLAAHAWRRGVASPSLRALRRASDVATAT